MSRVAPPTSVKGKPICLFLMDGQGTLPRWRMMQKSPPRGQNWPARQRVCTSPIMVAAKASRRMTKGLQSVALRFRTGFGRFGRAAKRLQEPRLRPPSGTRIPIGAHSVSSRSGPRAVQDKRVASSSLSRWLKPRLQEGSGRQTGLGLRRGPTAAASSACLLLTPLRTRFRCLGWV